MGRLCTIMMWVLLVVVPAVIVGGIVCAIVLIAKGRSWHIKANVESATLTRFDLGGNDTLYYNLTLSVGVRNANGAADIIYDSIAAAALYDGKLFGATEVPAFTQGAKTTTMIYPAFQGQAYNMSGGSTRARFNREKGEGVYSMDLKLYSNIKIEWTESLESGGQFTNSRRYSLEVSCALRVPRAGDAVTGAAAFNQTVCDVKY